MLYDKRTLKDFSKIVGKQLCWNLYCKKVARKKNLAQLLSHKLAVFKSTYTIEHWRTVASVQITHFVIFKPLSYYFEEIIGFDSNASIASRPPSRLIKPGDITKEF